jgi:hypothetical protein
MRQRIVNLRRARGEDSASGPRSAKHATQPWDAWQTDLIGTAYSIRAREEGEALAKSTRHAGYQTRAAAAARARRHNDPALAPPKLKAGRPATLLARLIKAGVNVHRRSNVSYRVIAEFLVDTVAKYLPPSLRAEFLGAPPVSQQKMRIALRLRQTARRQPDLGKD